MANATHPRPRRTGKKVVDIVNVLYTPTAAVFAAGCVVHLAVQVLR